MKEKIKFIGIIIILVILESCSNKKLNGHYHLEWDNNSSSFQIWNIKDNKMVINKENCSDNDNNCFSSLIKLTKNKITVDPWVDFTFETNYSIDKDSIISMESNNGVLKLTPHSNCQANQNYFFEKTKEHTKSFQLIEETMTGHSVLPSKKENELIVIFEKENENSVLLFNGNRITNLKEIPKSNNKSIWLHIDKRIHLNKVIPILRELKIKKYKFYFSALSKRENNEQIQLLTRNIESINNLNNKYEVDICEFCDKHKVEQIESILKVEIIEPEKYLIQGDTVDLFQTRKRIVRHLIKDRKSRLNTQIEFLIPQRTTFETYLRLIDEINFVHVELTEIMTYQGKNDKDKEAIRNHTLNRKKEFPIKIKEIIKKTTSNNVYN